MIRTEMEGGPISLNIGPVSLGIWGGGVFHYYIVQSYLKSISSRYIAKQLYICHYMANLIVSLG